jgi:hypothetical protein
MASTKKQKNGKNKTRSKRLIQKGGFFDRIANFFGVADNKEGDKPVPGPIPAQGPGPGEKQVGGKKNKKHNKRR